MMCKQTNGFLVGDLGDKITGSDEAYACTTTSNDIGPCARSVFQIQKVESEEHPGNVITYGQEVRFVSNPHFFKKPLYLHSTQCSPQIFARFSRNQEVCLHSKCIYNTVWIILPCEGLKSPLIGTPVQPNSELIIEHCATKEYLSNDKIQYGNEYGLEYEVSCKRHVIKHKAQQLENETVGKKVIDLSMKQMNDCNKW